MMAASPQFSRGLPWGRSITVAIAVFLLVAACGGASESPDQDASAPTTVAADVDATTSTTTPTETTVPEPPAPPVRLLPDGVETVLAVDYSTHPVGPYGLAEFEEDYGRTNSFGVEQGRTEVDADDLGPYLRTTHPAGAFGAGRSGVSFQAKFPDQDEVIAEWLVYLEPGWSWGTGDRRGGKLGGLMLGPTLVSGGRVADGSEDGEGAGGSVRLTWTDDGKLEAYVYHLDQSGEFGDKFDAAIVDGEGVTTTATSRDQPNPDDVVHWDVGRWQAMALRVKVNTPGLRDGEIDVYKDSERVLSVRELAWRSEGSDWGVSGFMHGFFFGGGADTYAPKDTSYSRVADIRVAPTVDSVPIAPITTTAPNGSEPSTDSAPSTTS